MRTECSTYEDASVAAEPECSALLGVQVKSKLKVCAGCAKEEETSSCVVDARHVDRNLASRMRRSRSARRSQTTHFGIQLEPWDNYTSCSASSGFSRNGAALL